MHALAANDDARQACPVNDKGIEKSGMGRADHDGRLFGRCLPPDNSHPVTVGSEEKSRIGCEQHRQPSTLGGTHSWESRQQFASTILLLNNDNNKKIKTKYTGDRRLTLSPFLQNLLEKYTSAVKLLLAFIPLL